MRNETSIHPISAFKDPEAGWVVVYSDGDVEETPRSATIREIRELASLYGMRLKYGASGWTFVRVTGYDSLGGQTNG